MVQGVGFRPLVYHIAQKYKIKGYVRNVGGYVEILAISEKADFDRFISELQLDHGNGSEIVKLELETLPAKATLAEAASVAASLMGNIPAEKVSPAAEYSENFVIIHSESSEEVSILPPDLPVCPKCQRELEDPANRRFHNPFISCVACGPRYTIIEKLPYDRDHTTMEDFILCEECHEEYTSPDSRRHHAQTISCDDCGPYLILQQNQESGHQRPVPKDNHKQMNKLALEQAAAIINNGGILAVKGIGGYHFVCSPFQEETVVQLRKLK